MKLTTAQHEFFQAALDNHLEYLPRMNKPTLTATVDRLTESLISVEVYIANNPDSVLVESLQESVEYIETQLAAVKVELISRF